MNNNQFYYDPNAYIKKQPKQEKAKVDLNHIERVIYPQPYENLQPRYDNSTFKPKPQPEPNPPQPKSNFDLSNILKLFAGNGFGDMSKMLSSLVQNFGGNKDLGSLLNFFKPMKKVEAKVVDENFSSDSISNFKRVE